MALLKLIYISCSNAPEIIRDLADLRKHSWKLLKCTCDTFGRMLEATTYSPSSSYVMIHVIFDNDIVLGGVLNESRVRLLHIV